ncbi:unnamed protein product [Sphagnum tenellum]
MDLPAVQVRVIREVNHLEDLIAELTSPSCTLEALKVEKVEGVEPLAFVEGGEIRERFASALGASKTLKSLDVAFCSDMLKVDDLCTLLQSNEVLKSLTVCSRFAESRPGAGRYTSLRVMLEQNSTLKRLGIAHLDGERWDLTELAGVLGSQSLLEQLSIEFHDGDGLLHLEKIFEMLAVNTNLRCLEVTCNQNIFFNEVVTFEAVGDALSAAFSRNEGSDHQANETLTRLVLPLDVVYPIATILRSNQTIRELVLTEKKPRHELVAASRRASFHKKLARTRTLDRMGAVSAYIVILLQALEKNNTLGLLDLSGCSAVQERQDIYDAILSCLETKPWLHLNLQDTPLSERKTALRQSLMRSNDPSHSTHVACMPLFSLNTSWAQHRNNCILFHRNQDQRTRGIEISVVKDREQVVQNARATFKDIVNISPNIYALNARSTNDVRPVLDFVFESLHQLLKRMPQVFAECAIMRHALADRAKDCLIKWNAFCDLCIQKAPTLNQGNNEQGVVLKRQKAIAANLHDTGDIIYFEGLEFIVVNPNWFCHDIMGFLINFRGIPHETEKGFATKRYMEHILAQSLSKANRNTPSKGGIHLEPNDLMRLMLNLDICYEQEPGNLDAGIYIPTILDANFSITEREKIGEGNRELTWPPPQEQNPNWVFLGRRLECKDRIRTFLTPGFFPRLQVALHNSFIKDGILSADFKLDKGLITLNFQGMDVFVESSGDVGYYIDVLVRSSWNHDETLEIVEKDIVRVIHETTHKCRGVWLVQSILRPQCVQELTLLKYRKSQVVAIETLKQELFMRGCDGAMMHCYTWKHVVEQGTNGQEITVLATTHDPIVKLLGKKETTDFMEWRRSQLEEVSSMFKLVEESTNEDHEDHAASSSNFHVDSNVLRRTPSGFHDSTLANYEARTKGVDCEA